MNQVSQRSGRLYLAASYGFPDRRAKSVQTSKMAEAYLQWGLDARIVYPAGGGTVPPSAICDTYGLHQPPRSLGLPVLRLAKRRRLRRRCVDAVFSAFALGWARAPGHIFHGRRANEPPLSTVLRLKSRGWLASAVFVEIHEASHYAPWADPWVDGYIVISDALKASLEAQGVQSERVLVARNGVDLASYEELRHLGKPALRRDLGLPTDRRVVCYTGKFYRDCNVEGLVAASRCVDDRTLFVLLGGNEASDVARIRAAVEANGVGDRVILAGHRPLREAMRYQVAADALVLPYDSHLPYQEWGSPLKLWEYIATGNPIVAFPIPAHREILTDNEVVWVDEESPTSLAGAIESALRSPGHQRTIEDVGQRLNASTWRIRAARIAQFMGMAGPWDESGNE